MRERWARNEPAPRIADVTERQRAAELDAEVAAMHVTHWQAGVLVGLLAITCATVHGQRAGRARSFAAGKIYSSPLKNFTVPAPRLCLGTKIQEQHNANRGSVSFFSDVGQLERIDYIRLEPDSARGIIAADSSARYHLYEGRLQGLVQPNSGTVTVEKPLRFADTDMLFALAEFPQGSVIESVTWKDGVMTRKREDSIRGLLVFVHGDFIYVLHHEVGVDFERIWPCGLDGQGGPALTLEEHEKWAKEGLEKLYQTMVFR